MGNPIHSEGHFVFGRHANRARVGLDFMYGHQCAQKANNLRARRAGCWTLPARKASVMLARPNTDHMVRERPHIDSSLRALVNGYLFCT